MTTTAADAAQACRGLARRGPRHSRARARPAAHVVLPAAGRLHAAAHHRADGGAERVERLLLPDLRQQLPRLPQAADLGAARAADRVRRLAHPAPTAAADRLAGPDRVDGAHLPDRDRTRLRGQRQPQLARPRAAHPAAVRAGQAGDHLVVRGPLRTQGEGPRRLDAHVDPDGARHRPRHRPRRVPGRPRHRARPDGDHPGDALGGRCARPAVRRLARDRGRDRPLPGHHQCRAAGSG